jgi:hypothetical protein
MRTRLLLGGLGTLVGLYGAYLVLTRQDTDQLVSAAVWLAAGVVLHDAVLAPVVLGVVYVGSRLVPALLDRDYTAGWLVLAGLVVLAAGAATLVRSRRQQPRR